MEDKREIEKTGLLPWTTDRPKGAAKKEKKETTAQGGAPDGGESTKVTLRQAVGAIWTFLSS